MPFSFKSLQIGVCFFYFLYHQLPYGRHFFCKIRILSIRITPTAVFTHISNSRPLIRFCRAAEEFLPCSRGESAAQQLDMSCTAKQKETSGKQRKATCILTFSEQKKHSFNLNDFGFQPFFCFLKNTYNFFAPYIDFL